LSRACLGKKIVFTYKWLKKTVLTRFRDAFGLLNQAQDNLTLPGFAGCDRAFAYRTIGDPCRRWEKRSFKKPFWAIYKLIKNDHFTKTGSGQT
jgi:hypothetical protein